MLSLPKSVRGVALTATLAVASLGAACDQEPDRPEALMDTTFLTSGDVLLDTTNAMRVRSLEDSARRDRDDAIRANDADQFDDDDDDGEVENDDSRRSSRGKAKKQKRHRGRGRHD